MVPCSRNAMTASTQSGFSERTNHSPCGLRRLEGRLQFFGRCTSGPCGGRKEGPPGRKGSVNRHVLRVRGTKISP